MTATTLSALLSAYEDVLSALEAGSIPGLPALGSYMAREALSLAWAYRAGALAERARTQELSDAFDKARIIQRSAGLTNALLEAACLPED